MNRIIVLDALLFFFCGSCIILGGWLRFLCITGQVQRVLTRPKKAADCSGPGVEVYLSSGAGGMQALTPECNSSLLGKQTRQFFPMGKITGSKTSEVDLSTFIAKEINTQQSLGLTAILCGLFFFKGITRNIKILPKHDRPVRQSEMVACAWFLIFLKTEKTLISWFLLPL